ncbi:unnamed protein product [Tuber melanosporum]|uniref:Adenylyltransferase and sulfurtransferase uba4 n=1 Tax=Tuber melanosporum (strain Mel28) TaxID=656061 RepID=D5GLT0_TUBMM|nr:uncharacterized protein GSTUM_00010404001 [Tuber melanosporum]CAZ85497.1 unnamed protein product [Tuber melanosporum]
METSLEAENKVLKKRISELEAQLAGHSDRPLVTSQKSHPPPNIVSKGEVKLSLEEYKRYGRQMILPEIGIEGQMSLKQSRVLIVGAGGLGCPAAAYLAGAGVGTLGIIDHDTVENSNLHRQIIHSTSRVGMMKVVSAVTYLRDLNPHPNYVPHIEPLTTENSLRIMAEYDLVLDCTDHPAIRYLINDVAVIMGVPIVSASALRTDGQLVVLNNPPGVGPCYRCIWPRPPPAESVVGCGEGGILGPVVGLMGVMQAIEAIKIITKNPVRDIGRTEMTLFAAYGASPFRSLKMRGRKEGCVSCGSPERAEKITRESIEDGRMDYVAFCGGRVGVQVLHEGERVSVAEYQEVVDSGVDHLLLDVRDETQFGICQLAGSLNIPYAEFEALKYEDSEAEEIKSKFRDQPKDRPVYVICRLGNDSQIVARQLKEAGVFPDDRVFDIKGGIVEWARSGVAGEFPEY